jgi:hypothetical protein
MFQNYLNRGIERVAAIRFFHKAKSDGGSRVPNVTEHSPLLKAVLLHIDISFRLSRITGDGK